MMRSYARETKSCALKVFERESMQSTLFVFNKINVIIDKPWI